MFSEKEEEESTETQGESSCLDMDNQKRCPNANQTKSITSVRHSTHAEALMPCLAI